MPNDLRSRISARWAVLLVASFALAGCTDKKPEESQPPAQQPQQQAPAPQPTPPAPETKPQPKEPPATSAPAKPEAARGRATQEPARGVPPPPPPSETVKPAPPPTTEAKPTPKEEPKPAQPEQPKPTPTPEQAKPAPPPPAAPPQPPTASTKVVPKDVVVMTGSKLGGVRLEHRKHSERTGDPSTGTTCTPCHHESKKEKPLTAPQQKCSDCHTRAAAPPMKTKLQAAFHDAKGQSGTCIDCHKAENAKGKKAPVKCTECHKKEIVGAPYVGMIERRERLRFALSVD